MRALRWLGWLLLGLSLLWLGGLAWFVAISLYWHRPDAPIATDAIVVLTGGRLRLDTGLKLLAAGRAKKLFISGVNPQVGRAALFRVLGPPAEREACCIVLGHEADNTVGNARETATWMRGEGYASLRLVTSWYHIERSLLEFRRAMPQARIIAHPVFATPRDPERWWGRHGAALIVIGEYHKYLGAVLRPWLDRLLPAPPGLSPLVHAASRGAAAAEGAAER
jgi:uncharacterized SAM-binding protein YcdF (DUF218 family)